MPATPNTIRIPAEGAFVYRELARQADVSPETFAEQSMRLGALLIAVMDLSDDETDGRPEEAGAIPEMSVLFEQPDHSYIIYPIDFMKPMRHEVNSLSQELYRLIEGDSEPMILEVDPKLMDSSRRLAQLFNTEFASYLENCFFYRWQWLVTRKHQGEILIDDGKSGDDYLIVEEDLFI